MSRYNDSYWPRYVSVGERQARARKQIAKLKKQGKKIQPVQIEGKKIARSFWGESWCKHLESFSDYENRLPRGRSYVRNGSVCHLEILPGKINAMVSGTSIYNVTINIDPLQDKAWTNIKKQCTGQIGSILELLAGKLSNEVMRIVTSQKTGLFPMPDEIKLGCSCPDWAAMCKHVAAVLYGIGNRLDNQPELLFLLRKVDPSELITGEIELSSVDSKDALDEDSLTEIFGVEIDLGHDVTSSEPASEYTQDENGLIVFTGPVISRLRENLGLTLTAFADKIHVSPRTISRWQKNPNPIKLELSTQIELETLVKFGLES